MQLIKQILMIILASMIVIALFLPLAQTEWADGMRSGVGQAAEGIEREGRQGPGDMPAGIGFIAVFIKEIVIMGIPALITLGLLKIIKRRPTKA